jgi:hypothetical protein
MTAKRNVPPNPAQIKVPTESLTNASIQIKRPVPVNDGPLLFVVHHKEALTRDDAAEMFDIDEEDLDLLVDHFSEAVESVTLERDIAYRLDDVYEFFQATRLSRAAAQKGHKP